MNHKSGNINVYIIVIITLSLVVAGLGGLAIMLYINNQDLESNQEHRVNNAIAEARLTTQTAERAICDERVNNPFLQFVGPTDLGRLAFSYPRSWSVYVAQDGINNTPLVAYLHPEQVSAIHLDNIFALRVEIRRQEYSTVINQFDGLVRAGLLRSSPFQLGDIIGTRHDGLIEGQIQGSQVVIRVRNYTVILRTDSETFRPDFERIINTIQLNL